MNMQAQEGYNPNSGLDRRDLANAIQKCLLDAGFTLDEATNIPGREQVWYREVTYKAKGELIKVDGVKVQVYTTIDGLAVRGDGKDAIRVVATYKNKEGQERGIVKQKRVNRTGTIEGIVERMKERMRDTWALARQPKRCNQCHAPMFESKKGNAVCADVCWAKKG